MHRRHILRSVRLKVTSAGFQSTVSMLCALRNMDWDILAETVGEHGGVEEALKNPRVHTKIKQLLRSMRLVQARVPCTDGSRHRMQSLMRSLQYWSGFPALSLTLNPADTHHPFTLHYGSLEEAATVADLPDMDTQLHRVLEDANLHRVVAKDPVAAVRAFHAHVHSFFEQCLGCSCTPDQLHPDGIAARAGASLFGDVFAAFGAIEPQMRGSLHIHLLLHLLAFQTPQDLFRRFQQDWKKT